MSRKVTLISTGINGNVLVYNTKGEPSDSGITLSSLQNGDYLPLAGGTLTGNLNLSNNATIRLTDGTLSLPSLTFASDSTTGFFKKTDGLGLSFAGHEVTITAPSISAGYKYLNIGLDAATNEGINIGAGNTMKSGNIQYGSRISNNTSATYAIGIGDTMTLGYVSIGLGFNIQATGNFSMAIGNEARGTGQQSFALGNYVTSSAQFGITIGKGISSANRLVNSIPGAIMFGVSSDVPTFTILPPSSAAIGAIGKIGVCVTDSTSRLDIVAGNGAISPFRIRKNTADKTTALVEGEFQFATGGRLQFAPNSIGWESIAYISDLGGLGSPLTTKGDIWAYSTTSARVPVGADNTFLIADSTQATGLRYGNSLPTLDLSTNLTLANLTVAPTTPVVGRSSIYSLNSKLNFINSDGTGARISSSAGIVKLLNETETISFGVDNTTFLANATSINVGGTTFTLPGTTGTLALTSDVFTNIKKNGVSVASKKSINFIEGSNITLTIADDAINNEIDITITCAGGNFVPISGTTNGNNLTGNIVTTGNIGLVNSGTHGFKFNSTNVEVTSGDILTLSGTNRVLVTGAEFKSNPKTLKLNNGGAAVSGSVAGIEVEESAVISAYIRTSSDRTGWDIKSPANAGIGTIITPTTNQSYTLPERTGTLALMSDLTSDNIIHNVEINHSGASINMNNEYIYKNISGTSVSITGLTNTEIGKKIRLELTSNNQVLADGSTTTVSVAANSTTVNSSVAIFTADMVGRTIEISGIRRTISTYVTGTQVTISAVLSSTTAYNTTNCILIDAFSFGTISGWTRLDAGYGFIDGVKNEVYIEIIGTTATTGTNTYRTYINPLV